MSRLVPQPIWIGQFVLRCMLRFHWEVDVIDRSFADH